MAVGEGLLVCGLIALWIFTVLDVLGADAKAVRTLPKPIWFLVVLLLLPGPVLWWVLGRPRGAPLRPAQPRRDLTSPARPAAARPARGRLARPLAPDDDPEFLAALARRLAKGEDGGPPSAG